MAYFTIKQSRKDEEQWVIHRGLTTKPFLSMTFDFKTAEEVAAKLNETYEEGVQDTKRSVIDKINNALFHDDD